MEIFSQYLDDIEQSLSKGDSTEHTHRPALKNLLESVGQTFLSVTITATNEPRRVECGAPDFSIARSTKHGHLTIGYVEAKDVGSSLDEAEKSEQLKRYFPLGNLLLTNYLEFRWYVDGERRMSSTLSYRRKIEKIIIDKEGREKTEELLYHFLSHAPEPIIRPNDLAVRMARLTHMIRDIVLDAFENSQASSVLRNLRGAMAETLIPDIEKKEMTGEFADIYAQTIAYGLFAARCNHQGPSLFRRQDAITEIPRTNPFLRKLFKTIAGQEIDDEPYVGFIDDLAMLLAFADMESLLEHFGKRSVQEDPVVHFYETFLAAYDPKLREARGVYYTPEPVVSYIVRSVNHLLQDRFGCPEGLADASKTRCMREDREVGRIEEDCHKVLILDPACGTGTFLYSVVDHIRNIFMQKNNAGMWSGYVKNNLLPRLFGFELLMAPYAVAHFKLGMQLAGQDLPENLRKKWAHDFIGEERLGVFLTNTLEEAEKKIQKEMYFLQFLSEEAESAANIKSHLPIMVIMGNPPYSGQSANRSWKMELQRTDNGKEKRKRVPTFIGRLIHDYFYIDGQPLRERNPKWLQDDYAKFIRWAQWRIEKTGAGVLAFVTNHSYLDNPTFRGMRQSLMKSFDDIYIFDLHGNTKKREKTPDGSPDQNVFDIQQGVAIGIFIKDSSKAQRKHPVKIKHAELWGTRGSKYKVLSSSDIKRTKWTTISPRTPYYMFKPQTDLLVEEYENGWKITEAMPINSAGIVTARDDLTIEWTGQELWNDIQSFIKLTPENARDKFDLGDDARDWKVSLAQNDLKSSGPVKNKIHPILYRPFDIRYTYYTGRTRGFICMPRTEVMRHLLISKNMALITTRQTKDKWDVFLTNQLCGHKSCAAFDINTVMPLYLYPDPATNGDLFSNGCTRHSNLNPKFIADIAARLNLKFIPDGKGSIGRPIRKPAKKVAKTKKDKSTQTFGPQDVFNYIYAVFHSPTYRERYAEFLKIDFPRVPLSSDVNLFAELCAFGEELVALHLLESSALSQPIAGYPVPGSDLVEKGYPKYFAPGEREPGGRAELQEGRVYINKQQYFSGVSPEIWEFHVGGYQVCEKWLKDRRGRKLSYEDRDHYRKIVSAISETMRLMKEIDAAIDEHGGWPIK